MLKIKLTPKGKKNQRSYRVVVTPVRSKLKGKYIDLLGTYDPHDPQNKLDINLSLYQEWIKKGALPTPTISKLIKKLK